MSFDIFIKEKTQGHTDEGFDALFVPDYLKDFQKELVCWATMNARAALFEDCGLGKTIQQLVWAKNVNMKTNGNVLILTPLSVTDQTLQESFKFGIDAGRSKDGKPHKSGITITNYEKLHLFDRSDFVGCVCDESSILKNFKGHTKKTVEVFMRKMNYRLLCTATASPNDYVELGNSSEVLGYLGYLDMLKKFFKSDNNTMAIGGRGAGSFKTFGSKFRFKGHSHEPFWRWVCSWARAIRKPSDIGFSDDGYILPKLTERLHIVRDETPMEGFLLPVPAVGLKEQRDARTATIKERCQLAANIINSTSACSVAWVYTNKESEMLKSMITEGVEVTGSESDEIKEEKLIAFRNGDIKKLITKPTLAGYGHNWQHCSHQTVFPSHSFEQYYQCVRRSWRFGQTNEVKIDMITTQADESILRNLKRKSEMADKAFDQMVKLMSNQLNISNSSYDAQTEGSLPAWMS